MSRSAQSRRQILKTGLWSGGALLGLGELPFLRQLGAVSAQEAVLPTDIVRLGPEIEPLVRLLEDTPRERVLEEFGHRVRGGASYREVLAALMLAAVRNIRPGPVVGQKLHSAMVVISAHLASQASPPEDRWLPVFWALDYFKGSQAQDVREGDWTMAALDDSALPSLGQAPAAFSDAMESWDVAAADRAIAGWVRGGGDLGEIYETLWRYGARDYRDIGHKSIYTANSYRTLQVIGRQHAEPVLRSLTQALLVYRGGSPMADARVHEPWQHTLAHEAKLGNAWKTGRVDTGATRELLASLRTVTSGDAVAAAAGMLRSGVSPQSIWDGLLLQSAELVLQRPRIFSLHALTTTNAMHFAWRTAREDRTRRLLLLQNAAYLPLFRDDNNFGQSRFRGYLDQRQDLRQQRIEDLQPSPRAVQQSPQANLEAAFATLGEDRRKAAEILLAGLDNGLDPKAAIDAARTLVYLKGDDAHDYKFCIAILEDTGHLSAPWRHRFLAANLGLLRGSTDPDNPLIERTRAAFSSISGGPIRSSSPPA